MASQTAGSSDKRVDSYFQRWQQLNDWLVQHRAFWQPVPFMTPEPDWTKTHPGLTEMLEALTDAECQHMDDVPVELAVQASRWVPSLEGYAGMVQLPELRPSAGEVSRVTLPEVRAKDMPGRKRLQSGAFAATLAPLEHPALDWCCGKGHLSRTLAPLCPGEVQGFEWNRELVEDGNRLARHFADRVSIGCQDVMAPGLKLPDSHHGVALHACGDLHRQLLKRGSEARLPRLSISPCCYHLTDQDIYRPLSRLASGYSTVLQPGRSELRLAVQETVTAPERVRAQTQRIRQWRLGFDGLQRYLRGKDDYLSVPTHPSRLVNEDFTAFCHWAAAKKQLELPRTVDFDHWRVFGERRLAQVRRHELVRHLFRRPLEVWMVLDYALFLEEKGYRVQLGQFCDRSLTPRNLLIDAVRRSGTSGVQRSRS